MAVPKSFNSISLPRFRQPVARDLTPHGRAHAGHCLSARRSQCPMCDAGYEGTVEMAASERPSSRTAPAALWRVPSETRGERIHAGLCAACGGSPATVVITQRARTSRIISRRERRSHRGSADPSTLPILCVPCAAHARIAMVMRRRPSDKLAVFLRDGGRCVYCGRAHLWDDGFGNQRGRKQLWGIDHVIPRAAGIHVVDNKAVSCVTCGTRKGNRTPDQWVTDLQASPDLLPPLLRDDARQRRLVG